MMTELKAFNTIWGKVKVNENYVPRNHQTIGGMWTVDTYRLGDITAQQMDEGYTDKIISEKVVAIRYYNDIIEYMKGNSADLIQLAEALS
jgi:hypothetical protein